MRRRNQTSKRIPTLMARNALRAIFLLLLMCAACGSDDFQESTDEATSDGAEVGDDRGTIRSPVFGTEPPYRSDELRDPLQDLLDTNENSDQLLIGAFEGQLLSRVAAADRFVRRVQALEPLTVDCLETEAGLTGEVAQQFARAMLSESFGIEGADGSAVVAFPDAGWQELGPSNPEVEHAADSSGCYEVVLSNGGGVFGGPVGQRVFELVRSDQWQTPAGFEDQVAQAIADSCGSDPFEECEDEDRVMVQLLPLYRETIRINLDNFD